MFSFYLSVCQQDSIKIDKQNFMKFLSLIMAEIIIMIILVVIVTYLIKKRNKFTE